MVKVVSITPIRSKCRVELDDGSTWWLYGKDLRQAGIREGAEIRPEELKQFVRQKQLPRGINLAIAMLARRSCSREEIRRKLTVNHYDAEVIEQILEKLEKEGFLNDRDFAEAWIRHRISGRYGARRIGQELRMKGVSEEDSSAAMKSLDEEEMMRQAVSLAAGRLRRVKPDEDPRKAREKILQALIRRGFDWNTAREAYDQAVKAEAGEEEEEEEEEKGN